jgi:hypothetical protein
MRRGQLEKAPLDRHRGLECDSPGRLVLESAGLVEERSDLLLLHVPDPVNVQQGRLAAEALDLLHEPLKELGGLGRLPQDPGRPAECVGLGRRLFLGVDPKLGS